MWQKIETAPKDGTHILLTSKGSRLIHVCRWGAGTINYKCVDEKWVGWSGVKPPTHWRPILEPPPSDAA